MQNLIAFLFTVAAVAASASVAGSATTAGNTESASGIIPGQYIVVLDEAQFAPPELATATQRRRDVAETATAVATEYRGERQRVFSESLTGFSASMSASDARLMASDPRIDIIVPDAWVTSAVETVQQTPPSWGLDRIDQLDTVLDDAYRWYAAESAGEVHVYVLDTGIRSTHTDFGGRVDTVNAFNAFADGNDVNDCNGHGTHVGGIIGGSRYGVAKNAVLHPVRVLACSGAGSVSAVIAGVDWITTQVLENQHPAVASLSLSTSPSQVLDDAIRTSIEAGVTYVAAAGNNNDSACFYSPARIAEVITVGATTIDDTRMASSNYGDCVDIYAPGAGISSTFNGNDDDTVTMSGTSMAAPHVTGTAALLLGQFPNARPAEVVAEILAHASLFNDAFGSDGTSPLLFSLIKLQNVPDDGGLELTHECNTNNGRCVFDATLPAESGTAAYFHWDFGDGTTEDSTQSTTRHDYQGTTGLITVILGVDTTTGESYLTNKTLQLPF